MPFITYAERHGMERGLEQGLQLGIEAILEVRFPEAAAGWVPLVRKIASIERQRQLLSLAKSATLDELGPTIEPAARGDQQ